VSATIRTLDARTLGVDVPILVAELVTAVRAASVDLLAANLPYVPDALIGELAPEVAAHEPRLALAGGHDGLDVIRRLVPDARRVLRSGGAIVLETLGPVQASTVAALLVDAGFVDVVTRDDLAGITRFVAGRRS